MDGKWKCKKPREQHLLCITYGCVSLYTNVSNVFIFYFFRAWSAVNVDVSYCYSITPLPYCASSLSQLIMMYCEVECCEKEQQNISLAVLWKQRNSHNFVFLRTTGGWQSLTLVVLRYFKYSNLFLTGKAKTKGHCKVFKVTLPLE